MEIQCFISFNDDCIYPVINALDLIIGNLLFFNWQDDVPSRFDNRPCFPQGRVNNPFGIDGAG
jgi:hypothetical protein